jgi:hypothetical protein
VITCPWCGTNYVTFQPNCKNCGGSLSLPAERSADPSATGISIPPPAPRKVPRNYAWRILLTDGWGIVGLVFLLLGAIFVIVGLGLIMGIVTALVGLPLAGLGALFFVGGGGILAWRYEKAQQTIKVLEEGDAVLGQIVEVYQNLAVQINGRNPWTVVYRYEVDRQEYGGKVTTLSRPDLRQEPGKGVYVLYSGARPEQSTIYPHPYGYYGV